MSATPLHDRLAELRSFAEDCNEADTEARYRQQKRRDDTPREVLAPLTDFYDAVRFKRPDAVPEDEQPAKLRELTDAIGAEVEAKGLYFKPVVSPEGVAVALVDPSVNKAAERTKQELALANSNLRTFERNEAEGLKAEREAINAKAIRDAVDSGDPRRVRVALGIEAEQEDVLTTDDLGRPTAAQAREEDEASARRGSGFGTKPAAPLKTEVEQAEVERQRRAATRELEEASARSGTPGFPSGFDVPDDASRAEAS